jgi:hypothetical protein
MALRQLWLGLGCIVFVACAPAAPPKPTWNRDIAPLVQAKCGGCHVTGGIAPFALQTFADFMNVSEAVRLAVTQRVMPPWPARESCTEYAPDQSLSDDQITLINSWLDEGAMQGDPRDFMALGQPQNALTRIDSVVAMKQPYTPTKSPDEYRCYVLDWPETEDKYITGYALEPTNRAMVHHADIFFINPDHADAYRANDPDYLGYPCYTLPVLEGGWIGTFVPGSRGTDFPDETDLKIQPGSKIFIQTHYNTAYTGAQPDQLKLNLRLESKVHKPAIVDALSDLAWIQQKTMTIPAFDADAMHRFQDDLTQYVSVFNSSFVDGLPLKVYAGTVHMHQMGSKATLEIVHKDGTKDCIVDIPKWQFAWQLPYTLKTPKVLNPGDQIAIECHWDNSQENQPIENGVQRMSRELNWGVNTDDEMCVGGIYMTE